MSEYVTVWVDDLPDLKRGEEIVRCRDCKHYKCGDDGWWCLRSISTRSNHPDGFCAWAERREQ